MLLAMNTRSLFHQHFTASFFLFESAVYFLPKRDYKKVPKRFSYEKRAHKTFRKLLAGVNFTNIFQAIFVLINFC